MAKCIKFSEALSTNFELKCTTAEGSRDGDTTDGLITKLKAVLETITVEQIKAIEAEGLTSESFLLLGEADLKELGFRMGDRKLLLRWINSPKECTPKPATVPAAASREIPEECAVFIDDSNLFIEAQKMTGKKVYGGQDPRIRIDIGRLLHAVENARKRICGGLYGSKPPPRDKVWIAFREQKNLEVKTFWKNYKGKEKEVDTAMTADATCCICERRDTTKKQTLIIVGGDRDFKPLVEKAICRGWHVEIYAFSSGISKYLKEGQMCKIIPLDGIADRVCFVETHWRKNKRTMPLESTQVVDFQFHESEIVKTSQKLCQFANEMTRITKFPSYWFFDPSTKLVFIIGWLCKNTEDTKFPDFFRAWEINVVDIESMCINIFGRKPARILSKSEYDKKKLLPVFQALPVANQFAVLGRPAFQTYDESEMCLEDEGFDPISSGHSDDEELCESDNETHDPKPNCEAGQKPDSDDGEEEQSTGFERVRSKIKPVKYPCPHSFACRYGLKCGSKHTAEERDFFSANGGPGQRGYKSCPCTRCGCDYYGIPIAPCCPYYHSLKEARCYLCNNSRLPYVGHASHDHNPPAAAVAAVTTRTYCL